MVKGSIMKRFLKAVAGFTLIELIVTLALLAIAATIAAPIIISNVNKKELESYRQACLNVYESAANIADGFNKGATNIGGVSIDPDKPNGGVTGVSSILNEDNSLAYKINIAVKDSSVNPSVNYSKDTVVVYFWYGSDDEGNDYACAIGCWYMVKGKTAPQYKFDYKLGEIAISASFSSPTEFE